MSGEIISSSSGMLPAWLCVLSVSFFAFLVGIGVGCDLMKRHEKAKHERIQEEQDARASRLFRGIHAERVIHHHPLFHATRYATIAELMPRIVEGG